MDLVKVDPSTHKITATPDSPSIRFLHLQTTAIAVRTRSPSMEAGSSPTLAD